MSDIKIVGISVIKNENLHVEWMLRNILNFCDEILVYDNMSIDNTFEIVQKMAAENKKIKLSKVKDANKTHKLIEKYASTPTWLFGVDGDEIYDPIGLAKLREKIINGDYQKYWRIRGYFLHCVDVNLESKIAKGYLAPPASESNKLYNFSTLKSWVQEGQRFVGNNRVFNDGFKKSDICLLHNDYSWEDAILRNLHLCFIKRSTKEDFNVRMNIREKIGHCCRDLKPKNYLPKKIRKYKKGELVTKDISGFIISE